MHWNYRRFQYRFERAIRQPVPSRLDPFRPYLRQRWPAGCHKARHLFQDIALQGFLGSEALVRRAVRAWRSALPRTGVPPRDAVVPETIRVSPRQASFGWLDLAQPHDPEEYQCQQAVITQLQKRIPAIQTAHELGTAFLDLVRRRRAWALPVWLVRGSVRACPNSVLSRGACARITPPSGTPAGSPGVRTRWKAQ
jgi:hypothetical protein